MAQEATPEHFASIIDTVIDNLEESMKSLIQLKTLPKKKPVIKEEKPPAGIIGSRSCQANTQWKNSLRYC